MAKGKQAKGSHKRPSKQPHKQRHQPPRSAQTRRNARRTGISNAFNSAKIEEYLTSHGLIRVPIVGDGNCLFRAMADQLGLGENAHRDIRRKVVETIRADEGYFVNFIDSDEVEGVEAYCDEMIQDGIVLEGKTDEGVWGGDIELEAFRRAYGRAIVIYDASAGTPYVKPYNGDEGKSLSTIHLWKSDCHYESVRNKEGPFDGPSRVIYKDVKMSPKEVERIQKEHEDAAIKDVLSAVPHININEIRRLLKEHGDSNKVVELLTGEEPKNENEQSEEGPTGEESSLPKHPPFITEDEEQGQQEEGEEANDALRMSIEMLSLETKSTQPDDSETPNQTPTKEPSPSPPPSSHSDPHSFKNKARQRRQVSAARKERQNKRMQKEAAKRRKRMETMGLGKEEEEITSEKHELKAIII